MKTAELNTEKTFDVALAEKRMSEIKSISSKIGEMIDRKILQGTQKLLQKILHNVSVNKKSEIELRLDRDSCTILYIYDLEKKHSLAIEISFLKKYDTSEYNSRVTDGKKEGDFKKINFQHVSFDLTRGDVNEDFDCVVLYGYIAKEFRDNGDFVLSLKSIYDDLRISWDEIDELWSEYRNLNSQKQKHSKVDFEKEIRKSNYFKEGNYIVIRKLKKDFLEASVYAIGKVQKTTFYCRSHSIEIKSLSFLSDKKQLYALSVESYAREDKRKTIDTFISIWADELCNGNKIEVLSTEEWMKLNKEIDSERKKIESNKLNDLSKSYHDVKYKKDDN